MTWFQKSALAFATVGGLGLCPVAPGTVGSLVPLAGVALFLHRGVSPEILLDLFLVLTCLSAPCIECMLRSPPAFPAKKPLDPSYIILDEVVGQLLAFVFVARFYSLTPLRLVACFLLFRLFDITKPGPIGWVDRRLSEQPKWQAIGVVVDDLLAGAVAGILVAGSIALAPFFSTFLSNTILAK